MSAAANRPSRSAPSRRARALAAAPLLALALLAGCGSSQSSGSGADPATVVPANAALYVGATLRPEGSLASSAAAAAQALTHQADPYARLVAALQTPGSPALSYQADVAPWLGRGGGVYLSSLASSGALMALIEHGILGTAGSVATYPFGRGGAQGALVLDTSDSAKALTFLNLQAQRAGAHAASYRGVAYQATDSGLALGLVDRLAVVGSVAGMRGVIDTTLSGSSLAHSPSYSKLQAAAPSGALAHVYSDPSLTAAGGSPEALAGLVDLLAGGHVANVSLVPASDRIELDADTLAKSGEGTGLLGSDPQAASALAALPGESWLALGLGDTGGSLPADVASLKGAVSLIGSLSGQGPTAASGTLSIASLLSGVLEPLEVLGSPSAAARRAFGSWIGPAALFASGASLLELRAGVIIQSSSAALSRAAVPLLGAALRARGARTSPQTVPGTEAAVGATINGVPLTLVIAAGRDAAGQPALVLGLGPESVTLALTSRSTLGQAASHQAAAQAIGEGAQPSLIAELPTLLSLLEGVGLTQDPTIAPLVPYLRGATTLSGGGHQLSGEIQRYRLVLGLAPAGG